MYDRRNLFTVGKDIYKKIEIINRLSLFIRQCICLIDYRTFIDNLKAFAEFIQWYKLYRL